MLTTGDTEIQELKGLHYQQHRSVKPSYAYRHVGVFERSEALLLTAAGRGKAVDQGSEGPQRHRVGAQGYRRPCTPRTHFSFISWLFFCRSANQTPRKLKYFHVYRELPYYRENTPKYSVLLSQKGAKSQQEKPTVTLVLLPIFLPTKDGRNYLKWRHFAFDREENIHSPLADSHGCRVAEDISTILRTFEWIKKSDHKKFSILPILHLPCRFSWFQSLFDDLMTSNHSNQHDGM